MFISDLQNIFRSNEVCNSTRTFKSLSSLQVKISASYFYISHIHTHEFGRIGGNYEIGPGATESSDHNTGMPMAVNGPVRTIVPFRSVSSADGYHERLFMLISFFEL